MEKIINKYQIERLAMFLFTKKRRLIMYCHMYCNFTEHLKFWLLSYNAAECSYLNQYADSDR
jgi:hypothetical protein